MWATKCVTKRPYNAAKTLFSAKYLYSEQKFTPKINILHRWYPCIRDKLHVCISCVTRHLSTVLLCLTTKGRGQKNPLNHTSIVNLEFDQIKYLAKRKYGWVGVFKNRNFGIGSYVECPNVCVNLPQSWIGWYLDRFHEAAGVFLTFKHSVNLTIQKGFNIHSGHYVTNGTLVNNNNTVLAFYNRKKSMFSLLYTKSWFQYLNFTIIPIT